MRAPVPNESLTTGMICASATTGALVALGHRLGATALGFNGVASLLLGPRAALLQGFVPLVTVSGVILNVVIALAFARWFVRVPRWCARLGAGTWPWATTLGLVSFAAWWTLDRLADRGLAAALPLGDCIVFAIVLVVSLPLGTRFAFSDPRRT